MGPKKAGGRAQSPASLISAQATPWVVSLACFHFWGGISFGRGTRTARPTGVGGRGQGVALASRVLLEPFFFFRWRRGWMG